MHEEPKQQTKIKSPGRKQLARELANGWAVIPVRGMNRKERRRRGMPPQMGGVPLKGEVVSAAFKQYREGAPVTTDELLGIERRAVDAPAPRRFARRGVTSAQDGPKTDPAASDSGGGVEEQRIESGTAEPASAR